MKLHRNLIVAVADALDAIFNENGHASQVVEKMLKQDQRWGSRDRSFVAETTYDLVRWKRLFAQIADAEEPFSKNCLIKMIGAWAITKDIMLPDWEEFEPLKELAIKQRKEVFSKERRIRESIPDWLDALGEKELGNDLWTKELHALNQMADVVIRANTLKVHKDELATKLLKEGIKTKTHNKLPDALILGDRKNVFNTQAFKNGLFEVQDGASQKVAPYTDTGPGMTVIDACAGNGGKTLHLGALMQNVGNLVAMDIHSIKLNELKKRAKRNGVTNLVTKKVDSEKSIKEFRGKADIVLLDVPCSGLGVMRRNPDVKWKMSQKQLDKLLVEQQSILKRYAPMVRPGGNLVYATCSILPSENRKQIDRFLSQKSGEDFTFYDDRELYASTFGFDGFYMAQLKRKT